MTLDEAMDYLTPIANSASSHMHYGEALKTVLQSAMRKQSPCDCCKYGPPSSADGKPCGVCPAEPPEEAAP